MRGSSSQSHETRGVRDLPYAIPWRSSALRLGAHRGNIEGSGGIFRDYVSLLRHPDPRRIDLRASMRDPFGQLHVKRFEQKSAVTLYALVDLSGSMRFRGPVSKLEIATQICAALAASSRGIGDAFGLIGGDDRIVPDLLFPATISRAREEEMLARLQGYVPRGDSVAGLIEGAGYLAGRRKLVFLISDFYLPHDTIEALFDSFAAHDVVPIVLRDEQETEGLPRFGLLSLRDLETGRRRMLLMRPSLRDAWIRRAAASADALNHLASRHGRKPFIVDGEIDWDAFGGYLMGTAA